VLELLREKDMAGVKVIAGGIIPDDDARELERQGVAAVFQPGASLEEIVGSVRKAALCAVRQETPAVMNESTPLGGNTKLPASARCRGTETRAHAPEAPA